MLTNEQMYVNIYLLGVDSMKIKSIKKQSNGKYKLKLDNNSTIITYDSVILNNNILYNQTLDNEQISKINKENSYFDIYNSVLKYVSKRMRSEQEIRDYLKKYELDDKNKKELIEKLKHDGIINDYNYTKAYIHDRILLSDDGPFKIKENLLKVNIENNIIDEEFSKIDMNIFEDKCKKIINKKIKNNTRYSNNILKRKISNELFLMGYNISNIDEYFNNSENIDILDKEYNRLFSKLVIKYKNEELQNMLFQKLYNKGFNKEDIWNLIKKDNF